MANLNLDFSSVQSNNVVLEEGLYSVVIEAVEEKTSSTGKPMLLVRFREANTNTALFENYVLTENCLWKLKELLDAAGVEADGIVDLDTDCLIGVAFTAKVIKEDYNGNEVNRIKKIFAA